MTSLSSDAGIVAFDRLGPDRPVTPLVVAVPHAGRYYPPEIDRARAVGWAVIEQLEDRYADRLIGPLVAGGAICIVARHARAWIDLNRAETDVATVGRADESARSRAGLGLVPTRVGGRPLWREPPSMEDVVARITRVHRPYHAAVSRALAEARAVHGFAVLIDCHSMPPIGRGGAGAPRIVIGDRHGASAGSVVSLAAVSAAADAGVAVARNAPYAGAHSLERHGRPEHDQHALQIEVDRTLYLSHASGEPSAAGVATTGALLAAIAWAAVAAAASPVLAIAAE